LTFVLTYDNNYHYKIANRKVVVMKHSNNAEKALVLHSLLSGQVHPIKIFTIVLAIFVAVFLITGLSGCSTAYGLASGINGNSDNQGQDQVQSTGSKTEEGDSGPSSGDSDENTVVEQSTESGGQADEEQATEITLDPGTQSINVYYADNSGEYLVGEARDVEGESKPVDAIYEMMKSPVDSSLAVLIPSTTRINSVKVFNNGNASVDFSQSFLDDRFQSDTIDILLVYSIVNTLTEFREIDAVKFYIDGKKIDILGQLDIEEPVYRRSDLIKQ
jgi:germination protein M